LARKDSRKRRFLSFRVTRASVEISSTINLTTISSTADVARGISAYILRRLIKCSIDSSISASASQLVITPLAACLTWTSEGYRCMNLGMVHTSSRIPRVECIAFVCGSKFYKNGQKCKAGPQDLLAYQAYVVGDGCSGRNWGQN